MIFLTDSDGHDGHGRLMQEGEYQLNRVFNKIKDYFSNTLHQGESLSINQITKRTCLFLSAGLLLLYGWILMYCLLGRLTRLACNPTFHLQVFSLIYTL